MYSGVKIKTYHQYIRSKRNLTSSNRAFNWKLKIALTCFLCAGCTLLYFISSACVHCILKKKVFQLSICAIVTARNVIWIRLSIFSFIQWYIYLIAPNFTACHIFWLIYFLYKMNNEVVVGYYEKIFKNKKCAFRFW